MQHAIEELKRRLETAEHNGKIRRDSGDTEQADLDDAVAKDCREAITVLENSPAGGKDITVLNLLRDRVAELGTADSVLVYNNFIATLVLRKQYGL